jgi:hypothetical protein
MWTLPVFQTVWLGLSLRDVKLFLLLQSELAILVVSSALAVLATGLGRTLATSRVCLCRLRLQAATIWLLRPEPSDPSAVDDERGE